MWIIIICSFMCMGRRSFYTRHDFFSNLICDVISGIDIFTPNDFIYMKHSIYLFVCLI